MNGPEEILESISSQVGHLLGRFFGPGSADSVFSTTTDEYGTTLITAAAWERVGGFGFGGGGGIGPNGEDGGGGGGGAGGISQGRPVAVIRVTAEGIELTPVVDSTKIAVTFLITGAAVWKALR